MAELRQDGLPSSDSVSDKARSESSCKCRLGYKPSQGQCVYHGNMQHITCQWCYKVLLWNICLSCRHSSGLARMLRRIPGDGDGRGSKDAQANRANHADAG